MEGIWYVKEGKVYCVEQTGRIAMCEAGQVSEEIAEDILNKYGSKELIQGYNEYKKTN